MSHPDRSAFLRTICQRPDDDTPRLVYADWLDEHGNDWDQVQAARIRYGIENPEVRLGGLERVNYPDGFPIDDPVVVRGFIEEVTVYWNRIPTRHDNASFRWLFANHPLRRIKVKSLKKIVSVYSNHISESISWSFTVIATPPRPANGYWMDTLNTILSKGLERLPFEVRGEEVFEGDPDSRPSTAYELDMRLHCPGFEGDNEVRAAKAFRIVEQVVSEGLVAIGRKLADID